MSPTVSAASPTLIPFGATSVTMTFPYQWVVTQGDGLGNNVTTHETWVTPNDTLSAVTALTQVAAEVNLPSPPAPICVPPVQVGPIAPCGIAGPIQGIVGLLTSVDWAPGYEYCDPLTSVAGHPIANPTSCHKTGDTGDAFADGNDIGLSPIGFPLGALRSPVDHFDTPGTVDVAVQLPGLPSATTSLTGYAFVYGREFPGLLPVPVDGNLYTGTGQYLDGGDSLVA